MKYLIRRIGGVKCNALERNIFRPALERNIFRPALERNILRPALERNIFRPALEHNILRPALERNILRPALERNSKLRTQNSELTTQMYSARILIENSRLSPFVFDAVEISSKSNF